MLQPGWFALISFVVTIGAVLMLRPLAAGLGLVDRPSDRKIGFRAVPLTGGIAMFAGLLAAMLACDGPGALGSPAIVGAAAFLIVGIVDDRVDLPPRLKLVGQVAAAGAMLLLGLPAVGPGELLGLGVPRILPLDTMTTIVFIVGVANAFNMLDGLDGLAGGAAAVALACLTVITAVRPDATLCRDAALLAAVLAFLVFNAPHPMRRQACVFMGDAGSLMLGGVVAALILETSGKAGPTSPAPAIPLLLWLVALPATDTLVLIVRRMLAGRSPMQADRWHIHHVLMGAGCNATQATGMLVLVCAADAAAVLLAWWLEVAPQWVVLGLLARCAGHALAVTHGARASAIRASAIRAVAPLGKKVRPS